MGTTCVPETFDIRLINAYFSCHEGARSLNKVLGFSIEAFVVSSMLLITHELITIKFLFPFLYDIISRWIFAADGWTKRETFGSSRGKNW